MPKQCNFPSPQEKEHAIHCAESTKTSKYFCGHQLNRYEGTFETSVIQSTIASAAFKPASSLPLVCKPHPVVSTVRVYNSLLLPFLHGPRVASCFRNSFHQGLSYVAQRSSAPTRRLAVLHRCLCRYYLSPNPTTLPANREPALPRFCSFDVSPCTGTMPRPLTLGKGPRVSLPCAVVLALAVLCSM